MAVLSEREVPFNAILLRASVSAQNRASSASDRPAVILETMLPVRDVEADPSAEPFWRLGCSCESECIA